MKKKVSFFKEVILGNEIGILPASLAFSFFLALIPIISLLFFVLTSFNLPFDSMQKLLSETFSSGVVELIQPILTSKISVDSIITLGIGLFVATNGSNSIIMVSNTIFGFENAPYLKRMLKALLLTLLMIILIAFIVTVPLLGSSILSLLGTFGNMISDNEFLINVLYITLQVPVSLIVIFIIVKMLYAIAPDQKIQSKYVTKGALFTTASWLLVTALYSYYINNIARYDLVYGNLANIVILLLWFYILAYIFVIGLYLNRRDAQEGIEKTNTIKLNEIKEKIKKDKNKTK